MKAIFSTIGVLFLTVIAIGQHSIARQWNDVLLHAIRNDYARPTVHARNLFHASVLMYDAWAVFEEEQETYFLGRSNLGDYNCLFEGVEAPNDTILAQKEVMSYAMFKLLKHRFKNAPKKELINDSLNRFMDRLGYDTLNNTLDYSTGSYAALGNYLASEMIAFGLQDGANEFNNYANTFYVPQNGVLYPTVPGNSSARDFNKWQPLALEVFVDQSGNITPQNTPEFLSAEWGDVVPFALTDRNKTVHNQEEYLMTVYHDPGPPFRIGTETAAWYKWGFSLVASWSSHLDPTDGVLIDISPNTIGNVTEYPVRAEEYPAFYDFDNGGDNGQGYSLNPKTGLPYTPQIVPRADYARVLAEFWADGPDSETPPGHWFTLLNYVSDHAALEKRWQGDGPVLSNLEWDVKAYFTLGGAMHDAAITAWSIKGYYDYIRPISAIRLMADKGQSSVPSLPNYHINGLPLAPGKVELVNEGDPLVGDRGQHLNKMKLYTWRGPDYISDDATDAANVGWILAENWWPYQRPTFVTPPFAGYVSGHSVFSRAAANVLEAITGDPFFPGGMGEFEAKQNDFLVFEQGPSVTVKLQWATYRDASDQTSLSRIWGGIHPPIDDIPGRRIGGDIGDDAFRYANQFMGNKVLDLVTSKKNHTVFIYPNPISSGAEVRLNVNDIQKVSLFDSRGYLLTEYRDVDSKKIVVEQPVGLYFIHVKAAHSNSTFRLSVVE